jgi:uncharacterized protein YaeQ
MALKATIYRAELQISDMDRHYYENHTLTLAQHPSETNERLMIRLLAFAWFAQEQLTFGRGLSAEDEPDLWRKSLTGEIEQWIDLGQPDESRIRKACGRAKEVVLIGYGGRSFLQWWDKNSKALQRCSNLSVFDFSAATAPACVALLERHMRLQSLIQDGELQLMRENDCFALTPVRLKTAG